MMRNIQFFNNFNRLLFIMPIIMFFYAWPLKGVEFPPNPPAAPEDDNHLAPVSENVLESANPILRVYPDPNSPRVRITLNLTPYKSITARQTNGKTYTQFVTTKTLKHVLRAKMEKTNHFFFSDWHIETVPLKWVKSSNKYLVRLMISKRFGAYGQVEEAVGSIDLGGVLKEQQPGLYILYGTTEQQIKNKRLEPVVDLVAGQSLPAPTTEKQIISKNQPQKSEQVK